MGRVLGKESADQTDMARPEAASVDCCSLLPL